MKRFVTLLLSLILMVSVTACGGTSNFSDSTTSSSQTEESKEEITESVEEILSSTEEQTETELESIIETTISEVEDLSDYEKLETIILQYVENDIASLNQEYENLVKEIDTYDKYIKNTNKIEAFYDRVSEDTRDLCIKMCEYTVEYAQLILSSDESNYDKYEDFERIFDCIYDEVGDDIFDEIYENILDDMYDTFYDGILEDAYDNISYSEWLDFRSDEYEWWLDTRSDVYEEWLDFRSDVYEFWLDMRSEMWSDDTEKVEEKLQDFKEDIEKLKNDDKQNSDEIGGESTVEQTESVTSSNNETSSNDISPEFKEAMDSYEAFFNEYVVFMKKYENSDGTDIGLLVDYGKWLVQYADMMQKFDDIANEDMTPEESAYYLEVQLRINQKLLEIAE